MINKYSNIFSFLQKNYGWMTALITGISVVVSFVLRFIKYIYSVYYFNYYGLSFGLFDSRELGFLYNFCFSILLILCYCSLLYCYIQLFNSSKKKLSLKTILFNLILIFASNVFIVLSTNFKILSWQFWVNVLLLIVVEVFFSFCISKSDKNVKKDEILDISNTLKICPFYFFLVIFSLLLSYGLEVATNKSYSVIDNNQVIVYTTNDYYLVLDCEIENDKLIIYKGSQTKIKNDGVESKMAKFDKVELK